MIGQGLINEIKEKYPKSYSLLLEYVIGRGFKGFVLFDILQFDMFYGMIESFFDENGIIIDVITNFNLGYPSYRYVVYMVRRNNNPFKIKNRQDYKEKNGTRYHAILKACEILEKRFV
jgi:hypothetical protein